MADGHGGRRKGSGRPPGAHTLRATILQRQHRARILEGGLTPLDVLMENMRFWHGEVGLLEAQINKVRPAHLSVLQMTDAATLEKYLDARARLQDGAEKAAPYVHARISPMDATINPRDPTDPSRLSQLTDDELDAAERIARKVSESFGDPTGATPAPAGGRTP